MPCYDHRDHERVVYQNGVDPEYQREANRLGGKVDELTDLLCKAGKARFNKTNVPVAVLKWWDDHCKYDRQRGEPW